MVQSINRGGCIQPEVLHYSPQASGPRPASGSIGSQRIERGHLRITSVWNLPWSSLEMALFLIDNAGEGEHLAPARAFTVPRKCAAKVFIPTDPYLQYVTPYCSILAGCESAWPHAAGRCKARPPPMFLFSLSGVLVFVSLGGPRTLLGV
ncbi:hypothetical protein L209DRAFT_752081 [Thermothelomyces heterothallicus CBS 203.75]